MKDLRRSGGYLMCRAPEKSVPAPRPASGIRTERLAGTWTGDLNYFPQPARLALTLRPAGQKCDGEVSITVPVNHQRYDAPLDECTLSGGELRFSVVTLPLPYLFDVFKGRMEGAQLAGTVERAGAELQHVMSGSWSLVRQPEAR